jgi:signal peptidase I
MTEVCDAPPRAAPVAGRAATPRRFATFRLRRRPVHPAAPFWRRFAADVARGCLGILLLHWFVLQISIVRGHSMEPSLADGDRLVVDRLCYCMHAVERFDVVVLRSPTDPAVDYVKRVIAVPGDRVRIEHGLVLVNDEPIESGFEHIDDRAHMAERRVPHDCCFVLGDNRPVSCDSREFGLVPLSSLKGKVRARFWPFSRLSLFP